MKIDGDHPSFKSGKRSFSKSKINFQKRFAPTGAAYDHHGFQFHNIFNISHHVNGISHVSRVTRHNICSCYLREKRLCDIFGVFRCDDRVACKVVHVQKYSHICAFV